MHATTTDRAFARFALDRRATAHQTSTTQTTAAVTGSTAMLVLAGGAFYLLFQDEF